MRTSYHSVSSARRLVSWLMAALGLATYVGLIYGLTHVPVQIEVPLPGWAVAAIPPVTYALLVWIWVRRPSIVRWLVGTAVLSGLHVLLSMAREPLTALLDPALAGRPLPWLLPPPLPEVFGLMLLLVPLRDVLRAPVRHARERGSSPDRSSASLRIRTAPIAPRPQSPAASGSGSLSEALLTRAQPAPEPVLAPPPVAPPPPPVETAPAEDPRRRRATARAERRRQAEPARPIRRSDVVLRIALDRIMAQLPPGTFLAPEDEVAASLAEPGYLRIPGDLVVTQLAEGLARVSWADIAGQFPARLVGLSTTEISEHLGEGLRLPLDEVIGQLPHELFVADAPEIESVPGLDRIPVPFHPVESSTAEPQPAPAVGPEPSQPAPEPPRAPAVAEAHVATPPPAPAAPVVDPAPAAPRAPVAPAPAPEPVRPARRQLRQSEAAPISAEAGEPTVRISFDRVASQLPADAFHVELEQVSQHMRQPGALLVPQSLVVPQLAEGLIQVGWDTVAAQFPHEDMAVPDAEMATRLPNGIRLPLDEIVRQVPTDLFMAAGPAADVRGLESFPAPFQPILSDPAPEPPAPLLADPAPVTESSPAVAPAAPVLAAPEEAPVAALPEAAPVIEIEGEPGPEMEPDPVITADALEEPVVTAVPPTAVLDTPRWVEPSAAEARDPWAVAPPSAPVPPAAVAGPADTTEARRIVAMLAPIASFDASVQAVEGVTVYALASPSVAQETAVAVAGLALPLLMDRRLPWPVDQITLRGPETALVLTPLGEPQEGRPVLAAAAPRGGGLALLEILCRRAAGDRARRPVGRPADGTLPSGRALAPAPVPSRMAGLVSNLTAFGSVTASVLRDGESEAVFYFFLPAGADVPAVGAFAQDLQAVMRKAAGSGAVFRTAILRSGDALLVIQPEEIGHGRSIVIVAGGSVTRPGLAYRQVERVAATLMSA
jgi:hypothetical protein